MKNQMKQPLILTKNIQSQPGTERGNPRPKQLKKTLLQNKNEKNQGCSSAVEHVPSMLKALD